MNVDLNKMPTELCSCGCPFFKQRTIIKKISAIIAATPEDQYIPVEFLACEACGKPHAGTTKINTPGPKEMNNNSQTTKKDS